MTVTKPTPFKIKAALADHPEALAYIDTLQKELEWKDKIIELTQRKEKEAKDTADETLAVINRALAALRETTDINQQLINEIETLRRRAEDAK